MDGAAAEDPPELWGQRPQIRQRLVDVETAKPSASCSFLSTCSAEALYYHVSSRVRRRKHHGSKSSHRQPRRFLACWAPVCPVAAPDRRSEPNPSVRGRSPDLSERLGASRDAGMPAVCKAAEKE
jgi:hypothetical protein